MIIDKIVDQEQNRLKKMGYDCLVMPVTLTITSRKSMFNIGNDIYIFNGLIMNPEHIFESDETVSIFSATDCIETCSFKDLNENSTPKLFLNYVMVRSYNSKIWEDDKEIKPYRIRFIKITPIKNN